MESQKTAVTTIRITSWIKNTSVKIVLFSELEKPLTKLITTGGSHVPLVPASVPYVSLLLSVDLFHQQAKSKGSSDIQSGCKVTG